MKSTKFQGKSPAQVVIHAQVALAQMGKLLPSVHEERRVLFKIPPRFVQMRPYTLLTSQFQQPTNKQDKQGQGLNKVVTCAGNLANHIANWREITTDPWILEAVSGYRLQLAS